MKVLLLLAKNYRSYKETVMLVRKFHFNSFKKIVRSAFSFSNKSTGYSFPELPKGFPLVKKKTHWFSN